MVIDWKVSEVCRKTKVVMVNMIFSRKLAVGIPFTVLLYRVRKRTL
jgi:hypothetical protein